MRKLVFGLVALLTGTLGACSGSGPEYDIVIYGGTSSGIIAAVQGVRMGKKVVVIEPSGRLGGLTAGGLGDTDHGKISTIGGLARDFYDRVGREYGEKDAVWQFEPKVALKVYEDLVKEYGIRVVRNERLDLTPGKGVVRQGNRITAIRMESGRVYTGRVFIDATYEGDLLAKAGVGYVVGREANGLYGETNNGIRPPGENELPDGIDPYLVPGDPASGLLPRVDPDAGGEAGDGDGRVQAYCFRMCLTDSVENRIEVGKPDGYDERDYELLFRALDAGMPRERVFKLHSVRGRKTDSNNHSGISCDYNGGNYDYAEADYATREAIARRHETYQRGLIWTVQNHPRIAEPVKELYRPWGLPKDEFTQTGHWTPQLYVREARRMVADYIVTEHVVALSEAVADPVGLGSYAIDSHHTRYFVNDRGFVSTEGGFYKPLRAPYPISYRVMTPKREECANLLVTVCVSATHAAYGSIRMEPVFMILGQSAATAAALCIDAGCAVQEVDYKAMRVRMDADGQILENPDTNSYKVNAFEK